VNNIVPIEKGETIIRVLAVRDFNVDQKILITTKHGQMKQSNLVDFEVSRYNRTLRAMKLSKDDQVVSVDFNPLEEIISISKNGYVLRFDTEELPVYGLTAGGVKSMSLAKGDEVAVAFYARPTDEFYFLTSRGHVIKDSVLELPKYARNRRGIILIDRIKTSPHFVESASRLSRAQVKEDVRVRILSTKEALVTTVSDLKYSGNKYGKKMVDDGYYIEIYPAKEEDEDIPIAPPKKEVKKEDVMPTKVIEETIQTKQNQKIRLSRLDLFDDE